MAIRHLAAVLVALLAIGSLSSAAIAQGDATPPVGSVEFRDIDRPTQVGEFWLSFTDPESALAQVIVSCDGGPEATFAYHTPLFVFVKDPAQGGCSSYGFHTLLFKVRNSAGLVSLGSYASVPIYPFIWLETPLAPVTGHPFTIRPIFPADYTKPSGASCVWEFRWGSSYSLSTNAADGTLGGMYFSGPAAQYCVDWTFTLPWAPVSQYQVIMSFRTASGDLASSIGFADDGRGLITATIDSTSRHITTSTIPIGYILPNKSVVSSGQSITYTRYLVNNPYVDDSATRWMAHSNDSQDPSHREQTGGTTFTYTPDRLGEWTTGWGYTVGARWTQAYIDPKVAKSGTDTTAPTVLKPVQRIGGGSVGTRLPTTITWGGADGGSGIDHYTLQRSRDSASWTSVTLSSLLTTSVSQQLDLGHTYRYRVRSVDRAGNRSSWAYGPVFKPKQIQEMSTAITYTGSWTSVTNAAALGGTFRTTTAGTARASYTFSGSNFAWLAEVGPGRGKVDIYIDGSRVTTVDLYSLSTQVRRIVFTKRWGTFGTHTISLRNKATFARPGADIDAFLLLR
jgi:hypothetical protein